MTTTDPRIMPSPPPPGLNGSGTPAGGGASPSALPRTAIHPGPPDIRDRAQAWLRNAMIALAVLAAAAAVVSWEAQYVLVQAVKHNPLVAALEAGIPDIGALIFAALGIALALHGRHAVRARVLNIACVGTSLAMNALASARGWQDLAIWIMPSAIYALASDTLIGVIRAWAIARLSRDDQVLAGDEATPAAIIGGLLLWLLRLTLAPPSTITGFRRWVLDECPTAPGRKASPSRQPAELQNPRPRPDAFPRPGQTELNSVPPSRQLTRPARPGKQTRMIALAGERHDLTSLPLKQVSGIANTIGAEVSLSPGTARRVLLAHVRALQNQDRSNQEHTP